MPSEEYEILKEQIAHLNGAGWADFPEFRRLCEEFARRLVQPLKPATFDLMFEYAWREGHASGYGNVATTFLEVVEIAASCNPPGPFPEL